MQVNAVEDSRGDEARYRFLALVFSCLSVPYLGVHLLRVCIGTTSLGAFLDALLSDPVFALTACGASGAVIAQVFRRGGREFSRHRTLCMIYVGGVAGLLAPTVTVLGLSPVIHKGEVGTLSDAGGLLNAFALLAGYCGERFFDWLSTRFTGRQNPGG